MAYQLTPFMIVYAGIFLLSASLGAYAVVRYLTQDRRLSVLGFATFMFSISLWEVTNFVAGAVTSPDLKLITQNLTNAVVVPIFLFGLLFFTLAFSGRRRWIPWALGVSILQLVLLGVLLFLDPEFLYESAGLVSRGPVWILGVRFDEWVLHDRILGRPFLLYQLYAYAVVLVSAGFLLRHVLGRADGYDTDQVALIALGFGTPLVCNGLVFAGALPPYLNFTDLAFGVTAVTFAVAIFRYRLFQLPPIGRQQLFDLLDDPLVFIDHDDRVTDSNPASRQLFDVGEGWRGVDATEFFAPRFEQVSSPQSADGVEEQLTVGSAGSERHFDVNVTTARTPAGNAGGRLVALRDVTSLERTRRDLERSNERLDEFASIVSHDLRTPLSRASLRTGLLAEEHPSEHTESVQDALDRMESIIDGMLKLARAGSEIETTEGCSLEEHVGRVWRSLQTEGAELDCRVGDASVEANPVRLSQILENLLGNALDHNGRPLTVRVGTLDENDLPAGGDDPEAIFIEDDGGGIPEDERDEIFEHGYTGSDDGTGYGLSIVRYIAEAHGWTIRVTDGTDGGARFEIAGLDVD